MNTWCKMLSWGLLAASLGTTTTIGMAVAETISTLTTSGTKKGGVGMGNDNYNDNNQNSIFVAIRQLQSNGFEPAPTPGNSSNSVEPTSTSENATGLTFFGYVGSQSCPQHFMDVMKCFENSQCDLECNATGDDDSNNSDDDQSIDLSNPTAQDCLILERETCSNLIQVSQCCPVCQDYLYSFRSCFTQSTILSDMCPGFSCYGTSSTDSSSVLLTTTTALWMMVAAFLLRY